MPATLLSWSGRPSRTVHPSLSQLAPNPAWVGNNFPDRTAKNLVGKHFPSLDRIGWRAKKRLKFLVLVMVGRGTTPQLLEQLCARSGPLPLACNKRSARVCNRNPYKTIEEQRLLLTGTIARSQSLSSKWAKKASAVPVWNSASKGKVIHCVTFSGPPRAHFSLGLLAARPAISNGVCVKLQKQSNKAGQ